MLLYVDKDLVLYRTGFILDDMGLIHQDLALTTSYQRDWTCMLNVIEHAINVIERARAHVCEHVHSCATATPLE
jgi:hypothetical protein